MHKTIDADISKAINIIKEAKKPFVVGIAASYANGITAGAGKSLISKKLQEELRNRLGITATVVSTDSFLLEDENGQKDFASLLLLKTVEALKSGKSVPCAVLHSNTKQGDGIAFIPFTKENKEAETKQSIIDFLGIDCEFEKLNKEPHKPISVIGETTVLQSSSVIIVEGSATMPIAHEIDFMIIGHPIADEARKGYIQRWKSLHKELHPDIATALGWFHTKKQPQTSTLTTIIRPQFINKYVSCEDFDTCVDFLVATKRLLFVEDYSPVELFNGEPIYIQEMCKTIEVPNTLFGTEFNDAHKLIAKIFNSAKNDDKKLIIKGGANNVFIFGGLNRDILSHNPREPQDFDCYFISQSGDEIDQIIEWIKTHLKCGVTKVSKRAMRQSKAIHLEINGKDYELNMSPIASEEELVKTMLSKFNFTINCFYRKFSEYGEKLTLIDVSGLGIQHIEEKLLQWTPGHSFSISDEINTAHAVTAFTNMMKMANLADGDIDQLFSFSNEVIQRIAITASENLPGLPSWKARHILEKEIPNELQNIKDAKIREHFENMIRTHPFQKGVAKRAEE